MRLLWLIQACWAQAPHERPSFASVVSLLADGEAAPPPAGAARRAPPEEGHLQAGVACAA